MRKHKIRKNNRIKKLFLGVLVLCMGVVLLAGCGSKPEEEQTEAEETESSGKEEDKIQIGLTVDSFVIERWIRDRDVFVATARELGADVNVQDAGADANEQISQIEYFISKQVDVIVVIARDCGVLSDAIQKGMPLIERVATVTGEKIKHPGNFVIKIGTSVKELIDYCGGFTDDDVLVKMGGPMMGFPLKDLEVPMMKGSNGIIAIDTDETKEQACIKCGRCVDVCPMELSPLYFVKYADQENWEGMRDMHVMDCVECRCCQYICSSKISIIDRIKAGKNAVRGMK